jgi:hypothetical protein
MMNEILKALKAQKRLILTTAQREAKVLRTVIKTLSNLAVDKLPAGFAPETKRRRMSAKARAKIAAAQRARWAKQKAAK